MWNVELLDSELALSISEVVVPLVSDVVSLVESGAVPDDVTLDDGPAVEGTLEEPSVTVAPVVSGIEVEYVIPAVLGTDVLSSVVAEVFSVDEVLIVTALVPVAVGKTSVADTLVVEIAPEV